MAQIANSQQVAQLRSVLTDKSLPMAKRFRTIFTLKNIGGTDAIDALVSGLTDKSALLKHEICFVLGQMADPYSIPVLNKILENAQENAMVRHEAGEALGAIARPESVSVLERFAGDSATEVAETCQIALDRIKWFQNNKPSTETTADSAFAAIDPAPAHPVSMPTEEAKRLLLDTKLSLFERYRALFTLRDKGDTEAVLALCAGLNDSSALFRHEVAFVLGQLQNPASIPSLKEVLERRTENPMVRHEAAEALGAVASDEVTPILGNFVTDSEDVVKESCEVALDIQTYFSTDEFQYADGLVPKQ
eukprot:TRINITY_DN4286_c0_g1_i1.p1 TRINITY_DN4286_c0_g1~~TRINITY_DN4286_c0_g1_i1.p1  ORF type:complete len:306 (-),score=44.08 TRINITY_DN4286_c0_g1_i1:9-926(-)